MILSDQAIQRYIKEEKLKVEPFSENSVQPASLDMTLGTHFLVIDENNMDMITMHSEILYREIERNEITLPPHSFLLATTREMIELPHDLVAFVEGRSSIGRMGLFIQNAGWVDPGFKGRITLELYNANSLPIKLEAGRRICQLVFCRMESPASVTYKGKYQGQTTTVGSRVYKDHDKDLAKIDD